jgi:hypothetical protein
MSRLLRDYSELLWLNGLARNNKSNRKGENIMRNTKILRTLALAMLLIAFLSVIGCSPSAQQGAAQGAAGGAAAGFVGGLLWGGDPFGSAVAGAAAGAAGGATAGYIYDMQRGR